MVCHGLKKVCFYWSSVRLTCQNFKYLLLPFIGSTPYPGIESKSLAQRLLDGYRMPKPDNCAEEV